MGKAQINIEIRPPILLCCLIEALSMQIQCSIAPTDKMHARLELSKKKNAMNF
jgi:hypothetical protein